VHSGIKVGANMTTILKLLDILYISVLFSSAAILDLEKNVTIDISWRCQGELHVKFDENRKNASEVIHVLCKFKNGADGHLFCFQIS